MGVHGLATYVRQNSSLRRDIHLPDPALPNVALIVDGLAFLFSIGQDNALRGGDYAELENKVRMYITYWQSCGLVPEFVFDGPAGSEKQGTVLMRSQQSLDRVIRYMNNLNDAQLQLPWEISKASKLPLLSQTALLATLMALNVPFHFAKGEADSPTAYLAEERQGFILSNDSDYFIFDARHRGYVPLQGVRYGTAQSLILTPEAMCRPACMSFGAYHSVDLANLLMIPAHRLPLFAALVGNDVADFLEQLSPSRAPRRFPGQVHIPNDIHRIARAIQSSDPADNLYDAVQTCINALCSRTLENHAIRSMACELVAAAESYMPVSIHYPNVVGDFVLDKVNDELPSHSQCRAQLAAAARQGRFNQFVLNMLTHKRVLAQNTVELTSRQSTSLYIGRPIRLWLYALLDDAIELGAPHILEVVRRGLTLRPEQVPVPTLSSLSRGRFGSGDQPCILEPLPNRLRVLATAFDFPTLDEFSGRPSYWLFVMALRWVQAQTKHPWTEHEILAAIICAVVLTTSKERTCMPAVPANDPPLSKHDIQLSAELVQALFYVQLLIETLLLSEHLPPTYLTFDGSLFHRMLDTGALARDVVPCLDHVSQTAVWELYDQLIGTNKLHDTSYSA
ncbi:hypothetical protein OIV83_003296 [Microbotryomycetes sp. JL201]|nr:hypothetical protein OIV83_003296 [Microbotryomycetes sp. JL201]